MSDGLDDLDRQRITRQRSSRARNIPPSRHPAPKPVNRIEQPAPATEPVPDIVQGSGPAVVAAPTPLHPTPAAPTPSAETPARKDPAALVGELIRTTLHLSVAEDDFLESVRAAGRGRRPRLDASRSAVTRYALTRLAAEMTPDQIVAALAQTAEPATTRGGRPRR